VDLDDAAYGTARFREGQDPPLRGTGIGKGRNKTLPYKKKAGIVRRAKTVVRKEKILCFARK